MADFLLSLLPFRWINSYKRFLPGDTAKRRRIYHRAHKMLNKQFDVKNLLRNSSLIKIMLGTMFNEEEALLLLFQRKQVIDPENNFSSSASDISFKNNFYAKMSSRDPWD